MENLLFVDFPALDSLSIFRNKIVLIPPGEKEQVSFLITSKQLADSYRRYFYSIWDRYKK